MHSFRFVVLSLFWVVFSFIASPSWASTSRPTTCAQHGGDSPCTGTVLVDGYSADGLEGPALFQTGKTAPFKTESEALNDYYLQHFTKVCSAATKLVEEYSGVDAQGIAYDARAYEVVLHADALCQEKLPIKVISFHGKAQTCPVGYVSSKTASGQRYCEGKPKPKLGGAPRTCEGNPCDVATGNKYQVETDYRAPNAGGLAFIRSYNSAAGTWRHSYERSLVKNSFTSPFVSTTVSAFRADGLQIDFWEETPGNFVARPGTNERLSAIYGTGQQIIGWQLRTEADAVEQYAADGKLLSLTGRDGLTQTLTYEMVGTKWVLKSVRDAFGRELVFANDAAGRIKTLTDPAGNKFQYDFDTRGRLATVSHPDGKVRTYLYNEPKFTDNTDLPFAMTGIIDENAKRFVTWHYNSAGKAVSSEHGDGIERVSLKYMSDEEGVSTTEVTDAAGNTRTYNFKVVNGAELVASLSTICDTCADDAEKRDYDENGNLSYRVDRMEHNTTWTYDLDRNLETSRLESETRLTTTEWHEKFRLPKKITVGNRQISFDYDPTFGTLLKKTVTDTDDGTSRTWTYTYYSANRLLKTIDGPRTDLSDITTFTYDLAGNLETVKNPLGQVTRFELYDKNGHAGSMTDPNGLVTLSTYDWRGNPLTRKVGQELTKYEYDPLGQLTGVTLPSGELLTYVYDDGHRLTDIKNSAGDRVHFTLDNFGNQKKKEVFDAAGKLTFVNAAEFDKYNRLHKIIQAGGQETTIETDANGNIQSVKDPLTRQTTFELDQLDRLHTTTSADRSTISQNYDDNDQLTQVINASTHEVNYGVTALGEVKVIDTPDPDAYAKQNQFDGAGNLKVRTDFRGIQTSYTYDALNRVKTIAAPSAATITFGYDAGVNGKGRLTSMVDESGTTTRSYNAQGRIESVSRVFSGLTMTTRYGYDAAGHLEKLTYPSGKVVTYRYDKELLVGIDIGTTVLFSNAKYDPFGGVREWRWGNGNAYARTTDLDGRIATYAMGTSTREIKRDDAGNIKQILDANDHSLDQAVGYDLVDRVTTYSTGPNSVLQEKYDYDLAGNRLAATIGGRAYPYTYLEGTDLLTAVAGPVAKAWTSDALATRISDGVHTFKFDSYRRSSGVIAGGLTYDYLRNGASQRVTKRVSTGAVTHYVYDDDGHLIAELDKAGNTLLEHVWLGDQPVGVVKNNVAYYVFADHLNTPRLITDTANQARWSWHSNPFGSTAANENPRGLGAFTYNQRFPGQYYDVESGMFYNYYRDYDPQTGRYIQSDPIGLRGGINTYGYVGGNPVSRIDPLGLAQCDIDAARITAKRYLPNLNVGAGPPKADYSGGGWWGEAQIIGRQPHYDGYIHMTTKFLEPLDLAMQARVLENYYHEAGHFTWPEAGHDTIYPYARANLERSWKEYKALRDKLCKCKK